MFRVTTFIQVILLISYMSCERDDNVYTLNADGGPKIEDIISFQSLSAIILEADSFSLATIYVSINDEADDDFREVSFTTSQGSFANGDTVQLVQTNSLGIASVSILSYAPGKAHLKAQVESYSIDTNILFIPSLPDDMLLLADQYLVDSSSNVIVTSQLIRDPNRGITSDNQKVYFEVFPDSLMLHTLIYPEFAFSKEGLATIEISNPFKLKGRFRIESSTLSAVGDTLSKSLFFVIK